MIENRSDKVHQHLDGELHRSALNADEVREVAQIEQVAGEIKRLHQSIATPDLTQRVMSRVQPHTTSKDAGEEVTVTPAFLTVVRRTCRWLWSPQSIRLRPAYGFAAAAIAILLVALSIRNVDPVQQSTQTPVALDAEKIFVQFRLDAPQASTVQLAGSFSGWQPAYALQESSPGIWSVLVPLEPGVHDYAFVVNGKWITDPLAPVVDDGFGGANSRLLIVVPDSASQL